MASNAKDADSKKHDTQTVVLFHRICVGMKRALFLVLPDVHLLDLAGPLQIVHTLTELGLAKVAVQCIGPSPRVRSFQGAMLDEVLPLPSRLTAQDVLIVIGTKLSVGAMRSSAWRQTIEWLRSTSREAPDEMQICGVCTGSFLMGHAGLLDGRLCTTHHDFTDRLRIEFPKAHVLDNRLLVKDGRLTTSAGVAAGIDLALGLVAQAFGAETALTVARENVVAFRRFGNDPELSVALRYRAHGNRRIHELQDLLSHQANEKLPYEVIAERSGLSARQLARIFSTETGTTMKQYQMELRMERAKRLVVDSSFSLEEIADRCGFASVQAFRANWNKREVLSPSAFRRARRTQCESLPQSA